MIKIFEKEPYSPVEYTYEVEKVLFKTKSNFQEILVIQNQYFGKMLFLDGILQISERDEFFYHEMLTHIVMHAHPNPKRILVIGGGDGGVVREVLKHKHVEKVYFVEIDEEVINVSKEFFPNVSCSIDDCKVETKIMDGADFIKKCPSKIDVIIIDSTDIIGFARSLFSEDFFVSAKKALSNDGFFVTHSESLHFHQDMVIEIQKTLKKGFPIVDLYTAPIATYPGNWWTFAVASKQLDPREIRRPFEIETRYYDNEIHAQSFLTKSLYMKLLNKKLTW
ncbi:MAG: polyamine aminopropyltransferase [bacterium]